MTHLSRINSFPSYARRRDRLDNVVLDRPVVSYVLALVLGMTMVLGYAPFHLFLVPVVALAGLFRLVAAQASAARAALAAFCFGLGMFGTGVSWVFISLHTYGGMPAMLAVGATGLFCAFLALFPTLFGTVCWYAHSPALSFRIITVPALWVGSEWLRGTLFTGFPWLTVGYSQIPGSPLSGYAPVFGVYGLSAVVALTAAILLLALFPSAVVRRAIPVAIGIGLWIIGAALQQVAWTSPVATPIPVAVLQGNIPQDRKWRADALAPTLQSYLSLARQSQAKLVVLPETAIPVFADQMSAAYATSLAQHAANNNGDMIIGIVERVHHNGSIRYYNSAISTGTSPAQTYRKQHLVPFGEYIPPLFGWVLNVLQIPLTDMTPGAPAGATLKVAGEKVATNICFEDVFGEEIIRALPNATLLVNLSNIAWFGDSLAIPQHLQISQTRALETGRYMLRATNTGATAIIDQRGRVVRRAPSHETFVLTGMAQGFSGATPYVRFGNAPTIVFICAGTFMALWFAIRRRTELRTCVLP